MIPTGISEWTPTEYHEKTEALRSDVPRHLVSLTRSALGDSFELVDHQGTDLAKTSFETAAVNSILAWLNFPYKLRPFLDSVVGIAGSCGTEEFTATHVELARQVRTGKAAKDDSLSKWVSRQKKQFREWQGHKGFKLIEITPGAFDSSRQKNAPTKYKVLLVEWAHEAVRRAQSKFYWRSDARFRHLQVRAIRQAAYELLQSMPECPRLDLNIKTLSEEDKLDRRVHLQISSHLRNLDFLDKMDIDPSELHAYVVHQLNKAYIKHRGLTGEILTPLKEEPDVKSSVWFKLRSGTLLEETEPVEMETIKTVLPRLYKGDKFVDIDHNLIPTRTGGHDGTSASDNYMTQENDGCKPLQTNSVEGTFLPAREDASVRLKRWIERTKREFPEASIERKFSARGVWQIGWDNLTAEGRESMDNLSKAMGDYTVRAATLDDFRAAFKAFLTVRLEYHESGAQRRIDREREAAKLFGFLDNDDDETERSEMSAA